jgi:ubiquinone/menaquinone biosynthesis C-methylase UbiE
MPREGTITCTACRQSYPLRNGILDFLKDSIGREVITPFQRLMQFPPIAVVYERYWRPIGFFVASSSSFRHFSKDLIRLLRPGKCNLILDLACGPGLFSCPLAATTNGWVIGLDLSLPMLRQARRKADALGIKNLLLIRGSALQLPFQSGAFEATLCSGALHLFERPELALSEVSRILSPGGCFLCQTTIRPKHSAGLASFLDRFIRFGFFDSPETINEKVRSAGMTVERSWNHRIVHVVHARRL